MLGYSELSVSGETAESESGSGVCITYKHVKNWAQEARTDRRAAKTNKLQQDWLEVVLPSFKEMIDACRLLEENSLALCPEGALEVEQVLC